MDLTIELQRICGTAIRMMPLIFGTLGTISNNLFTHMASLPINNLDVSHVLSLPNSG